jgi:hypothetical protein
MPEYRSIFAVDIEKSSGRGNEALLTIRAALRRCVSEAVGCSGISWDDCLVEDMGDGLRVTTPEGTARTSLLHPLLHELAARLRDHNRMYAAIGRIRARMAMHSGDVFIGSDGIPVGSSLAVLTRLLDSSACRNALAAAPESTSLALVVSQHFYEEAVAQGCVGVEASEFRRVEVEEKEYAAGAWLYVPGAPPPADRNDKAPGPAEGAGKTMTNIARDHSTLFAVMDGNIIQHHHGADPTVS